MPNRTRTQPRSASWLARRLCDGVAALGVVAATACAPAPGLGLATSGAAVVRPLAEEPQAFEPKRSPTELYERWGTRWCFGAGAPISGPPALGPGGEVYVATQEGYLHALNADGAFRWSYTVKGAIESGPVVLPGGVVAVATEVRLIYAIRPNGRRLWVYRAPEPIETSLSLSAKGTLVFGAARRFVYAVSSRGGLIWRVKLGAPFTTPPVVYDNGGVFIGTETGVVHWVAPLQRELWESPPVEQLAAGPTKLWVASGRMFSSNGEVQFDDEIRFARALPNGDLLVVKERELSWFEPNGALRWRTALPVEPSGTPVVGPNGSVWIPTLEGTVLRATAQLGARRVARVGFSPVSELKIAPSGQHLLAGAGEGNVCAVSLTRGSSHYPMR